MTVTTYFDDLAVGDARTVGSYEVTREEIVEFAEAYDPQPFHVDEEAARDSIYGGLIASGWHTAAMTMRVLVEDFLGEAATMGSPGVDRLRWHQPVRPGDELSVRTEVREIDPEGSRHGGLARIRIETVVDDDVAMSMIARVLFERRDD